MRLCSLICLLLLVSCGKNTEISSNHSISAQEQRDYLTIPHKDVSLLRNKLLNKVIEKSIPIVNPDGEIKSHDELDNYQMDSRDLADYEEKEKSMAKVIVSFPEKTEIYFVSERILISDLASSLGIFERDGRVLRWQMNDAIRTYAGGVFYLLSLKSEDLIKNDQDFFKKEFVLKGDFMNKSIPFSSKKNVEVTVDYEFLQQKLEPEMKSGTFCTTQCFTCEYKLDKPSENYQKVKIKSVDELGFAMRRNGRILASSEMELRSFTEGSFTMRAKKLESSKTEYTIDVVQTILPASIIQIEGREYSHSQCPKVVTKAEINKKVNFKVTVKLLGRGEDLSKIVL